MRRSLRASILGVAAVAGTAAMLAPGTAFSHDSAGRDVRVFHKAIPFTRDALRDPGAIGEGVGRFAGSVFGVGPARAGEDILLSQFTGTVSQQARREGWKSLVIDVWVGGRGSPAGYYFRYEGRDAVGALVRGESFLAARSAGDSQTLRQLASTYQSLVVKPRSPFLDR